MVLGWSAARVAADGPPVLTPTPGVAAPATALPPATPQPEAPAQAVLLLSNGQVVQGTLEETDDGYVVHTPIGQLPYRRRQVEKVFASIAEVYDYRRERTPESDPDERLKLAQWCLAQKLNAEAQTELKHVLALNPEDPRARSMLFQLQSASNRGLPTDASIQRTGAEQVEAPAPLSSSMLKELREAGRNNPLASGMPVIFDLPQAMAVKRYQEFAEYVHPALQRTCAQCHNEEASSSFQLIQARTRRDLSNDLMTRANLDATLRLINPKDPSKSTLLSAAIMPHPPSGKPILTGPNHPTYRLLITWVQGLRSNTPNTAARPATAPAASGVVPTAAERVSPGQFAADRLAPRPAAPVPAAAPQPAALPAALVPQPSEEVLASPHTIQFPNGQVQQAAPAPAGQMLPGSTTGIPTTPPPPAAFKMPSLPGPANPPAAGATAPTPAGKDTVPIPGLGNVPVMTASDIETAARERETEQAAGKKKKGVDASALQKFMMNRQR